MRILLYGASGTLGQWILSEALNRGHAVTAAARNPAHIPELPGVTLRQGDLLDADSARALAAGHDVVVSAIGLGHGGDTCLALLAARSLLAAAEHTGVRLAVVGWADAAETAPCVQLVRTDDFASTWTGDPPAPSAALDLYRAAPAGVDWTYCTPGAALELGLDEPARLSAARFAAALLDEVEHPRHSRQPFVVP